MAQLVKCPTSAQDMISQFVSSSPASGSVLTARSLEPAVDSVSPSLCPSPVCAVSLSLSLSKIINTKKKCFRVSHHGHGTVPLKMVDMGRLGGSVCQASDFRSGHDLTVPGYEPPIGLCADSSEPGAASDSVSPSLSAPSLFMLCLSLYLCLKK